MAPDPIVQERVYRALKADLQSGLLLPGTHAGIRDLAKRNGSSETPVREAGWRAVGEGLLDPDPAGGFRSPPISEAALRDMYRWNAIHTCSALSVLDDGMLTETASDATRAASDEFDPVRTTATLFDLIAVATGNAEFISATSRMNARLGAVRIAEHRVLAGNQQEIIAMLHMFLPGPSTLLQESVQRYHAVRVDQASRLIQVLHDRR